MALLDAYCERAPANAGRTTLGDGIELWQRLSPSTRTLFERKRLMYVREMSPPEWKLAFQTDSLVL